MVVVQQPAQRFAAFDLAGGLADCGAGLDQSDFLGFDALGFQGRASREREPTGRRAVGTARTSDSRTLESEPPCTPPDGLPFGQLFLARVPAK